MADRNAPTVSSPGSPGGTPARVQAVVPCLVMLLAGVYAWQASGALVCVAFVLTAISMLVEALRRPLPVPVWLLALSAVELCLVVWGMVWGAGAPAALVIAAAACAVVLSFGFYASRREGGATATR